MNFAQIRMRLANKGRGEFRAEAGVIWLYDTIAANADEAQYWGGIAPETFIAALSAIDGPVLLRIHSPGGSVFGAQAMVAAMREHPHAITAQIDSLAASAASVIAVNAASCVMVPGSDMMIHKAWGLTIGNADDCRHTADLLDKLDGQIADAYAAKAGGEAAHFLEMMAEETWFTAEEAVAAKLADSVKDTNTQRPKAKFDLTAFAHAPETPEPEADEAPETKDEPDMSAAIAAAARQRRLAVALHGI